MDDGTLIAAIVAPVLIGITVQFGAIKYSLGKLHVKVDRNCKDIQRLYRKVNGGGK